MDALLTHNPKLTGERMNEVNEASPASETSDVERIVMRHCVKDDGSNMWYIDCTSFYCDVEQERNGGFSVYFRNRESGLEAFHDA